MLRLLTYTTPSHAAMCKRFVLDRASGFGDVICGEYPQTCKSGRFKQPGWNECMNDKLHALLRLPTDDVRTVYVDSDVILLDGFAEFVADKFDNMKTNEIAFADDIVQWCCGVMLFRSTKRLRKFFKAVAYVSKMLAAPDQDIIHFFRQNSPKLPLPVSVLDRQKVCNWATVSSVDTAEGSEAFVAEIKKSGCLWEGQQIVAPDQMVAFHANFCVGVEAKMLMLSQIEEIERQRLAAEPL